MMEIIKAASETSMSMASAELLRCLPLVPRQRQAHGKLASSCAFAFVAPSGLALLSSLSANEQDALLPPSLHASTTPSPTENGTMADASTAFGIVKINLCLAFAALQLSTFLNPQFGAGTTASAEAPLLPIAAEVLPPLASAAVLFVAVALTYDHLMAMGRPVAGAGNGRRSISGLLMFVLCVSVGTLEFIVFGKAAGGGAADHGAQARALGLAALYALPAAATGTFFSGMTLLINIIVAHVRAGGEGGGAVAGDGPIQGLLRLLTKVAAGAAAALLVLMAIALIPLRS